MKPNTDQATAIPTTYAGTNFRSRLEAKWAAFFDLCAWPWHYEPLDLAGYIPDFILTPPHAPILIEVKPLLTCTEQTAADAITKIEKAGWDNEALIVGAIIHKDLETPTIGLLRQDGSWADAYLHHCQKCGHMSFHHSEQTFFCRINGCYHGDGFLGVPEGWEALWRQAGNLVQWARPANRQIQTRRIG